MEHSDWLENRAVSFETCLSPAEIEEQEDQIAAALCATEPKDLPAPDPVWQAVDTWLKQFTKLSINMRDLGKKP